MNPFIDVIGTLIDNPEGSEPVVLDGWHVNVTPEVMAVRPDLEPFVVTPTRLRQVWTGDDFDGPTITVALRFVDEAEAVVAGL